MDDRVPAQPDDEVLRLEPEREDDATRGAREVAFLALHQSWVVGTVAVPWVWSRFGMPWGVALACVCVLLYVLSAPWFWRARRR